MARDVKESLQKVSSSASSVHGLHMRIPTATLLDDIADAYEKRGTKKRINIIEIERQIQDLIKITKLSSRLFAAHDKMAAHPTKWKTLTDVLKWEDTQKKGISFVSGQKAATRKELLKYRHNSGILDLIPQFGREGATRVRNAQIDDIVKSIENPEAYKEEQLKRKYGESGAQRIIDAKRKADFQKKQDTINTERNVQYARGLANWREDQKTERELQRDSLIERYGGNANPNSARMADDELEKEDKKRSQLAASRASISTRRMRLEGAERFPMWKSFFKDSHNEAKDIRHMTRTLTKMSKVPIVGHLMRMNPMALGATAAIAGIKFATDILSSITKSSVKEAEWENVAGVWGKPSEEFTKSAMDAGLKGPDIDKMWAKFQMIGGAEGYAKTIGGMSPGMAKGFLMQGLGWNEDMMRIVDKMHGAGTSESRKQMTASKAADIIEEYGWAPEMPESIRSLATKYKTPLLGGLGKMLDIHYADEGVLTDYAMQVLDIVHKNAQSDLSNPDLANKNNAAVSTSTTDSHNVQINQEIHVQGGGEEAGKAVSEKTSDAALAVIQKFDGKAQ